MHSDAKRVLLVDDQPDVAEMIGLVLKMDGYECRAAETGHEALEVARTFDPDVVILDIGLPDLSGYDVARALRQRAGSRPYLVALTGWGQPLDRARAFEAGFDKHLLKPQTAASLRGIMRSATRQPV
jgi:DNA-binding response OmpR family regulator